MKKRIAAAFTRACLKNTFHQKVGRIFLICVSLCMLLVAAGCGSVKNPEQVQVDEITIPVMFLVNPDTGENENEGLVDAFNEAWEGTYQVEVEWVSDTAEGYRSRIKNLNAVDKLPAVITDVAFDADFYDLMVANHRLVDLTDRIAQDEEWKQAFDEGELGLVNQDSIYLIPSGNSSLSYGGFFYYKDMLAQAGIENFPDTWDGFYTCLEQLKAEGITPLAIHGGSSYWTPMLMATGYVAGTEAGRGFLNEQYPDTYSSESGRELFRRLKGLYAYSWEDALGIERTEAAKRFAQREAAITANGGWMLLNFSDEQKKEIGFAPFPGNVLMENLKMSAWAVTDGYAEAVTQGAEEFLKFRTLRDQKEETAYLSGTDHNTADDEYRAALLQTQAYVPNYQLKWEEAIQEEFFANTLPQYIQDKLSEDAFIQALDDEVTRINSEK